MFRLPSNHAAPSARPRRAVAVASMITLMLAAAPTWGQTPTELAPLTPRQVYLQTLDSIALIGTDQGRGTGWVWDLERRLIVTNDHVIEGVKEIDVFFPVHRDGVLQVELEYYLEEAKPIKGVVIDSDEVRDLALIQLESLPKHVKALQLAERSAGPGERVHAIGGLPRGSEGLWKYSTGFVSQVAKADISQSGREVMTLESNIDINKGNSGGPLVNDEGKVVGVAQSYFVDARAVSFSVDVSAIRNYVGEVCPLVDADSAEAKVALGRRHQDRGRHDIAMKLLTEALEQDDRSAEGHTARGWSFIDMGDYVTAVTDFTAAIEIDASDAEAWQGRSLAHRRLGDLDKALSDISRAIMNDTGNGSYYNQRAIIQEKKEEYKLALGDYQRAIELDPSHPVIRGNYADLLVNLERYQDAIQTLALGLEQSPAHPYLNHLMGRSHYRLREYQQAASFLATAVKQDSENVRYLADWGDAEQALENHDLGIKIWSKVIELQPYPYAFYSRAWSLRRIGRFEQALGDMNRAIEMGGDETPAAQYYERGMIHDELQNAEAAREDLAAAARIDPANYGSAYTNAAEAPFLGRWYVNQFIDGSRFEMDHVYKSDGTFVAVMNITTQGEVEHTEERGTFHFEDGNLVISSNLGDYEMPFKMGDGKFWLFFEDNEVWVGSVSRSS
ncbi:MAG: tetratricopeptide repeat protein [Planctomycetota bacterium]